MRDMIELSMLSFCRRCRLQTAKQTFDLARDQVYVSSD